MQFLSPRQAAKVLGIGQATAHRHCVRHDGFAQWLDGHWRIPLAHVTRVQEGETPAQIARRPSLQTAAATGSGTEVRARLLRAFIFAKALHLHDDLAVDRRKDVLTHLADELLYALTDLGLVHGDLREMILQADACAAYSEISGFPVEV